MSIKVDVFYNKCCNLITSTECEFFTDESNVIRLALPWGQTVAAFQLIRSTAFTLRAQHALTFRGSRDEVIHKS